MIGNFKKVIAILMTLPTAALIAGFVVMVISLPWSAIPFYKALATGQLNINLLGAAAQLFLSCLFGVALVAKLRAQKHLR